MSLFVFFVPLLILLSFLWLGLVIFYIDQNGGLTLLTTLNVPDFSLFVASVFLPLLMVWVVGIFSFHILENRKKEKLLSQTIDAVKRLGEHSEAMNHSSLEMETRLKNESLLKKKEDLNKELFQIISKIYTMFFDEKATEAVYFDFWEQIKGNRLLQSQMETELEQNDRLYFYAKTFVQRAELLFRIIDTYETDSSLKQIEEESPKAKVYAFLLDIVNEEN